MYNNRNFFGSQAEISTANERQIKTFSLLELGELAVIRSFMIKHGGVYCWQNKLDNKIYIGSTKSLWRRFLAYKNAFLFRKTKRINKPLYNAVIKYGVENFKFYLLEIFNGDDLDLRKKENDYFSIYSPFKPNGYNIAPSAITYRPVKFNEEAILAIKNANTGENSSNAKLNDKKIKEIKIKLANGESLKTLAAEFKVSTTVISNIKRGLSWSHIIIDEHEQKKVDALVSKHKRMNLSENLVKEIKRDILSGKRMVDIAKKYNLQYTCISGLKYGNFYKDIIP